MTDPRTGWAEEAEARTLTAAIRLAAERPWGGDLLARAAAEAGLGAADAALLFPNGARDLAALFLRRHDAAAMASLAGVDPTTLKVRERIRRAVEARIGVAAEDAAAVRRCTAFLAMPQNAALGVTLLWESADLLWRWAGDTATDENHYSKRAILSGILATTLATRLDRGPAAAAEHLNRRIEQVMAFEKWKAGLPRPSEHLRSVAGLLGRLRYGRAEPPVSPGGPSAG